MSKEQKKEFRKELKRDLKSLVKKDKQNKKGVESVSATQAFDTMLALAMVFGAAGVVFTVLASVSNIFWVLGAISIVIGAYFFIQWVNNGNG
jgi:1,4-dihydroxy-2-naphthoate octaprenyltransferase